jgi:hypothetical protein
MIGKVDGEILNREQVMVESLQGQPFENHP